MLETQHRAFFVPMTVVRRVYAAFTTVVHFGCMACPQKAAVCQKLQHNMICSLQYIYRCRPTLLTRYCDLVPMIDLRCRICMACNLRTALFRIGHVSAPFSNVHSTTALYTCTSHFTLILPWRVFQVPVCFFAILLHSAVPSRPPI